VFDDPTLCWRGMKPLFDLTLKLSDESDSCEITDTKVTTSMNRLIKELLQSIGALLVTRSSIILSSKTSDEIHLSFNGYLLRFSEAFESREKWLDNRMSAVERSQVALLLQKLGILSFFDSAEETAEDMTINKEGAWLYEETYSIRAAYLRMGPKVKISHELFTDAVKPQDGNVLYECKRKKRSREDSVCEEPIMDYINDDITRVIFGYLGYKILVRVTTVCHSWLAIGNENTFWAKHFIRRFKPVFLEELIPVSVPVSVKPTIKNAFISKHCQRQDFKWRELFNVERAKEKALRSKISKNGFRHRRCRVLGCTAIIRKKEDEKKHMGVHLKDIQKKLSVLERAEARQETKLQKEELQKQNKATKMAQMASRTKTKTKTKAKVIAIDEDEAVTKLKDAGRDTNI